MRLTVPLTEPAVLSEEIHVYVGFQRSAQAVELRRLARGYRPNARDVGLLTLRKT